MHVDQKDGSVVFLIFFTYSAFVDDKYKHDSLKDVFSSVDRVTKTICS